MYTYKEKTILTIKDINKAISEIQDSWERYKEAKENLWNKHRIAVIEGDPPVFLKIEEDVFEMSPISYEPYVEGEK